MKNADARPGSLPTYVPAAEAEKVADKPIGPDRLLTLTEEADRTVVGLPREDIAELKPNELATLSNIMMKQTTLLLGS